MIKQILKQNNLESNDNVASLYCLKLGEILAEGANAFDKAIEEGFDQAALIEMLECLHDID